MIEWIKPNGNKLTTNEEKGTIEYCESLGFKRAGEKEKPEKKKAVKKKAKD